jgi:uncharacterized protein (TIGR03545 family)
LVIVVAVLAFVLSGFIVERVMEKAGTALVGAKVDVDSARLTLSPLGLTVTGLQVTNPRRPMENSVEVRRIALNMNAGALVRRKLLVEEMAVEGMMFSTPRKRSGALTRRPTPEDAPEEEGFRLPPLKIPPVSEILAKESLISVQRAEALQKQASEAEESIEGARAELPGQDKAEDYRKRLDKLLSGSGIDKARLDDAKKLRDEIRADIDKIKSVENQITGNLSVLRTRFTEARSSVGEDVKRLKEKYALTSGGLANITGALFGEKAGLWAQRGAQALKLLSYLPSGSSEDPKKARPPRGKGVNIPLRERRPLPDFWIKRTALSLQVPSGSLEGEARDLTSDPSFLKKPTTAKLVGKDLPGGASLTGEATFNRTDPTAPRDDLQVNFTGWQVRDLALSGGENLPVTLRQGAGVFSGNVVLKGDAVEGSVHVNLASARLEAGGESDSSLARAIREALESVDQFSLTANMEGTLDDPKVRLSSDLDRVLQDAVRQAAREESNRLEAGLRKAIEEKTGPALAEAQKSLKFLETVNKELRAVKTELEESLKLKALPKLPF